MNRWSRKPAPAFLAVMVCACSEPNITKGEPSGGTHGGEDTEEAGLAGDSGTEEGPSSPEQPCALGEPLMEMGTGEDEFLEITDGDEIEVIHGTQDGHHILGSLKTKFTAEIVAVRFRIIPLSDGIAISDQTYRVLLLPDESGEPCTWSTVGMYAYLGRIDPGSAPFLDNPVEFRMDLVDDYGQELSQSLELVPFLTPVEHDTPPSEPSG